MTAAANIRASSFGIPLHSLFDAKGIAGNIVHAVATTNAIIAGLIVIEAIKVLEADFQNCRCVLINLCQNTFCFLQFLFFKTFCFSVLNTVFEGLRI